MAVRHDYVWVRQECVGQDCVGMSVVTVVPTTGKLVLVTGMTPDNVDGWDELVEAERRLDWDAVRTIASSVPEGDGIVRRVVEGSHDVASLTWHSPKINKGWGVSPCPHLSAWESGRTMLYDAANIGWRCIRDGDAPVSLSLDETQLAIETGVGMFDWDLGGVYHPPIKVDGRFMRTGGLGDWKSETGWPDTSTFPWCVLLGMRDGSWVTYALCVSKDVADLMALVGGQVDMPTVVVPVEGAVAPEPASPEDIAVIVMGTILGTGDEQGKAWPTRLAAITKGALSGLRTPQEVETLVMRFREQPGRKTVGERVGDGEMPIERAWRHVAREAGQFLTEVAIRLVIRYSDEDGNVQDEYMRIIPQENQDIREAIESAYAARKQLRDMSDQRILLSDAGQKGFVDIYAAEQVLFFGIPVSEKAIKGVRFPMTLRPTRIGWAKEEWWDEDPIKDGSQKV